MSGKTQLPDLGKIFREEDDDGFLPSGGSRLASIFGLSTNKVSNNSVNKQQTLEPKQSGHFNTAHESKTEVIIAKAVHTFKLQNEQYAPIGKLGIALTGNSSARSYQLILYRNKQEHISIAVITPDFSYTVQANNYSTYYDAQHENWSILFGNDKESLDFAREVGLAKYFSRSELSSSYLIFQDLNAPEKSITAKEGDKLSLKYVINTDISQPWKNNSAVEQKMTVEISTDDNWERILLGSNKNLKRLLIIPPNKQISLGPGFPKDKDIALEIEITDIRSSKEAKVSEVKSSVPSGKAAILSRMAKMGQSILPKTSISTTTTTTTDSEDTEEEVRKDRLVRHRKPESSESYLSKKQIHSTHEALDASANLHKITRPKHVLQSTVPNSQGSLIPFVYAPPWSGTQMQPQYVTMDGQAYPIAQQTVPQPMLAASDPSFNVFLAETRTQNTEIRMGMNKIADNVQKLLEKFHVLELQNASSPSSNNSVENTLKMILAMNASQKESENLSSSVSKMNITTEDSSDNLIKAQLQQIISAQKQELETMREKINSNEQQLTKLMQGKVKLEEVNLELKEKVSNLERSLKIKNQEFDNLTSNHEQTREVVSDYQRRNLTLEEEISQLKTDCEALENATNTKQRSLNSRNEKTKEIKLIMNKTYHFLLEQFTEERYSTTFIKETIASTLRDITLQVLKDEKTVEEFSESNSFDIGKKKQDFSEKMTVLSCNTESQKKEKESELQFENRSLLPEINVKEYVQIAPSFENEPPPIPPMDDTNQNEWNDY